MELRPLVGLAVAFAVAARFGLPHAVPTWVAVPSGLVVPVVLAAVRRRRSGRFDGRTLVGGTLAVASVLAVGLRADADRAALDRPGRVGIVEGVAWVVGDPVRSDLGVRTVLRLDGARYWTQVPTQDAAVLRDLLVGDRVHVRGRVVPFEGARDSWRWSRHLAGVLQVDSLGPGPPTPWWAAAPNAIRRLLTAGASGFDEDRRALYLGLVVGDDRDQTDLDRFRFRASGLGHLLAVSGQNVALTLAAASPLLLRLPRRVRPFVGAAVVGVFVLVTRAEPSVLRASVMAVVVLLAAAEGRAAGGVRALAWSVLVLCAADPLVVHSLGFILSVTATLGLALGSGPVARRLPGPRWWRELVGASLAAQLATLPVQLAAFGVVPVVSLPANVLAVPAAGVVVVLGATLGVVAGLVHPSVAGVLTAPVGAVVGWIDSVATWSSRVPVAPLDAGRSGLVLSAVAGAWLAHHESRRSVRWTGVVVASGVLLAAVVPVAPSAGRHRLSPASVLEVDTGGRRSVLVAPGARPVDVLDALWRLGVARVDGVRGPAGSPAVVAVSEHFRVRPAGPPSTRHGG